MMTFTGPSVSVCVPGIYFAVSGSYWFVASSKFLCFLRKFTGIFLVDILLMCLKLHSHCITFFLPEETCQKPNISKFSILC